MESLSVRLPARIAKAAWATGAKGEVKSEGVTLNVHRLRDVCIRNEATLKIGRGGISGRSLASAFRQPPSARDIIAFCHQHRFTKRLADGIGLIAKIGAIASEYPKVVKAIRMKQFASNLADGKSVGRKRVVDQIRDELQLAEINERIGTTLATSTTASPCASRVMQARESATSASLFR